MLFLTSKSDIDWWATWCQSDLNILDTLLDDFDRTVRDRRRVAWYFSACVPQDPPTEGYLVLKDRLTRVDDRMGNIWFMFWLFALIGYVKEYY